MKVALFSAYDDLIKLETAVNEVLKTAKKVYFVKQTETKIDGIYCKQTISVWYDD